MGSIPTLGTCCKVQQGRELGGFVSPPLQPLLTTLWLHCAVIVPLERSRASLSPPGTVRWRGLLTLTPTYCAAWARTCSTGSMISNAVRTMDRAAFMAGLNYRTAGGCLNPDPWRRLGLSEPMGALGS